jgi:hypothetical protein
MKRIPLVKLISSAVSGCAVAALIACGSAALVNGLAARADGPEARPATTQPALTRAQLEKRFAVEMTDATLSGSYSLGEKDAPAGTDHYTIVSAVKGAGDRWTLNARIQYGSHDLTLPLSLPVRWAGDTPVICVDNIAIPGIGAYSARVMIYNDQYVGAWSGNGHGGQMWGHITHEKPKTPTTRPSH